MFSLEGGGVAISSHDSTDEDLPLLLDIVK
jgi:hypothetical protein